MKKLISIIAVMCAIGLTGCADRQEHAADETTGSSAATSSYGTGGAMGPAVVEVTGSGTASATAPATSTAASPASTSTTATTGTARAASPAPAKKP